MLFSPFSSNLAPSILIQMEFPPIRFYIFLSLSVWSFQNFSKMILVKVVLKKPTIICILGKSVFLELYETLKWHILILILILTRQILDSLSFWVLNNLNTYRHCTIWGSAQVTLYIGESFHNIVKNDNTIAIIDIRISTLRDRLYEV